MPLVPPTAPRDPFRLGCRIVRRGRFHCWGRSCRCCCCCGHFDAESCACNLPPPTSSRGRVNGTCPNVATTMMMSLLLPLLLPCVGWCYNCINATSFFFLSHSFSSFLGCSLCQFLPTPTPLRWRTINVPGKCQILCTTSVYFTTHAHTHTYAHYVLVVYV